jgi:hypothetical protein
VQEDVGATVFDFGDGNFETGPTSGSLWYLVTSVNVTDDWLFGVALDSSSIPAVDTAIDHTYAAAGNYTAQLNSCCRLTGLVNASGAPYIVQSIVNAGGTNAPPVSTLTPIVNCAVNAVCSFTIPASDANGDPLTWRFSSSSESGIPSQPGPNAPAINSTNGQLTWDTTGAGAAGALFALQVTIEDHSGGSTTGPVKSKTSVDFIIQLGGAAPGSPPAFVTPTPGAPACNTTIPATVGAPVNFTVKASDPDPGNVTLTGAGVPPGATLTPALPASGNPVQTAFAWTPPAIGTTVMTFAATDPTGRQVLCSITIVASTGGGGTAKCDGKRATIVGTNKGENIEGTPGDDVIVALGGNDWIKPGGGNDVVCAGDGTDRVDAGDGDDLVFGQGDRDQLNGGRGDDVMYGGGNNDLLRGGDGNDKLFGETGDDHNDGGPGTDVCDGGPGTDTQLHCP